MALRRIEKELIDINRDQDRLLIKAGPKDESNQFEWEG